MTLAQPEANQGAPAPAGARTDVCFPVRMRRPGQRGFVAGETMSLSMSDMLVSPEETFPASTEVDIEIMVGQGLPACRATVAAHEPEGMRLTFGQLPEAFAELITRLLRDQAAFGDYNIEELIGIGGMARVYRALVTRGPHKGRTVALKRLSRNLANNPEIQDLFLSEADLSRMLKHPGIVEVVETTAIDDTYFIAMEHLAGGSIDDLTAMCREHRMYLPVDLCCYVVGLVANALEYTHTYRGPKGDLVEIVHCDVTPANILIAETGEIKLTDFGVAHIGTLGSSEIAVVGKALYQPPEQIIGGQLTPESDIFSLSAVLYEMLTNKPAFAGADVAAIHKKIQKYRVRPPHELRPEIPAGLSSLIMQGLSPDRACDKIGIFKRLWRRTLGRRLPKRVATAAEFGARVRGHSEPLYASPEVMRVVVNKLRELQRFRPLFDRLETRATDPT